MPCYWHRPTEGGVTVDWPVEYQAWAASEHLMDRVVPSPRSSARRGNPANPANPANPVLRILTPPDGAVYLIDPTLRAEFQTLTLRAAGGAGAIEWRIDDHVVGMADSRAREPQIDWPLTAGRHSVSARDAAGQTARASVVVK
jgi:membrane carboxypeptidase/penicillin-binding protein PbpC